MRTDGAGLGLDRSYRLESDGGELDRESDGEEGHSGVAVESVDGPAQGCSRAGSAGDYGWWCGGRRLLSHLIETHWVVSRTLISVSRSGLPILAEIPC